MLSSDLAIVSHSEVFNASYFRVTMDPFVRNPFGSINIARLGRFFGNNDTPPS